MERQTGTLPVHFTPMLNVHNQLNNTHPPLELSQLPELMTLSSSLLPQNIYLDVALENKEKALRFIADKHRLNWPQGNADDLFDSLLAKEALASTGLGKGIAIPHAQSLVISESKFLLVRTATSIPYDSHDGIPVDIILALLSPKNNPGIHLTVLAQMSMLCMQKSILDIIRFSQNPSTIRDAIINAEPPVSNE